VDELLRQLRVVWKLECSRRRLPNLPLAARRAVANLLRVWRRRVDRSNAIAGRPTAIAGRSTAIAGR
jgi:hypothetical protein